MVSIVNGEEGIVEEYPLIVSFICGFLFLLLTRSQDIIKILKRDGQRTEEEKLQFKQGLSRALILEAFLFLPASIVLFRLTIFPLIYEKLLLLRQDIVLWYAVLGIAAYGFPFASVRGFIKMMALRTLRGFAEIVNKADQE